MPIRKFPLATDHYYHIFNRGANRQPTFTSPKEFKRTLSCLNFYRYQSPPVKLSRYLMLNSKDQLAVDLRLQQLPTIVDIVCFCLMNNHFHLLLKQTQENGITKFMNNLQNSYTHYFNLRHNREGVLWQGRFKNVLVETDVQLIHLSRYIHLNPYSTGLVTKIENLVNYEWSSFPEYLGSREGFSQPNIVLGLFGPASNQHSGSEIQLINFKKNSALETSRDSRKHYRQFVFDQVDHQKQLEKIKHLTFES